MAGEIDGAEAQPGPGGPPRASSWSLRGCVSGAAGHARDALVTAAAALASPLQVARETATGVLAGIYIGAGIAAATGSYGATQPLLIAGAVVGLAVGLIAALLQRHRPLRQVLARAAERLDAKTFEQWALKACKAAVEGLAHFYQTGSTSHGGVPLWSPFVVCLAALTSSYALGWVGEGDSP